MALEAAYRAAVRELEGRGVMPDRAPSLDPMRVALSRLELEFDPERTIIVAGTNGKGSVSAGLDALYRGSGERTGLYTSPHLVETTERIRLGGEDISRELFLEAHERVVVCTQDLKLSHFEVLTTMAAWVFFSPRSPAKVSRAILEVGLGGIWDATNAIPHSLCVITRLGLDHQNLLGATLPEIALNKFGVIPERGPWAPRGALVAHAPLAPSLEPLARETRERTQSRWVESAPFELQTRPGHPPEFLVTTRWGTQALALPGRRGAENTALALTAFELFGADACKHLPQLARLRWPGRMERLSWKGAPCPVYVSGDHNPQGVESLLELLPAYPRKKLFILAGIGGDKNAEEMLAGLHGIPHSELHLTETPFKGRKIGNGSGGRGGDGGGYGIWAERASGLWPDPIQGLREICARAGKEDLILVTGSLYLVGAIYKEANQTRPGSSSLSKP